MEITVRNSEYSKVPEHKNEMCSGKAVLRESDEEITLFKSIGMAMSDLVGAGLAYNNVIKDSPS